MGRRCPLSNKSLPALSKAYGFEASAANKSEMRGGFLVPALKEFERVGPTSAETGAYPRLSVICGDFAGVLRATNQTRAFAGCAAVWPVEVTRERLVTWLPTWGLATEEEASGLVKAMPKAFISSLIEAEKTQTLAGVAYLCAERLGKPFQW